MDMNLGEHAKTTLNQHISKIHAKKHTLRLMPKRAISVMRCEGLEPPTYWFVASHSIQLS